MISVKKIELRFLDFDFIILGSKLKEEFHQSK
jgi:hypothetical protein